MRWFFKSTFFLGPRSVPYICVREILRVLFEQSVGGATYRKCGILEAYTSYGLCKIAAEGAVGDNFPNIKWDERERREKLWGRFSNPCVYIGCVSECRVMQLLVKCGCNLFMLVFRKQLAHISPWWCALLASSTANVKCAELEAFADEPVRGGHCPRRAPMCIIQLSSRDPESNTLIDCA